MRRIYSINLNHNYCQFSGNFYLWFYLSFEEQFAPLLFEFNLPDGRNIKACTEAIFFNSINSEKRGVESIKNTRAGQLLRDIFKAPELEIKSNSGWHNKLFNHAAQYYHNDLFSDNISPNPLTEEIYSQKTLIDNGIVKLLMLRKLSDSEFKNYIKLYKLSENE
jgi:hypothetical protein